MDLSCLLDLDPPVQIPTAALDGIGFDPDHDGLPHVFISRHPGREDVRYVRADPWFIRQN